MGRRRAESYWVGCEQLENTRERHPRKVSHPPPGNSTAFVCVMWKGVPPATLEIKGVGFGDLKSLATRLHLGDPGGGVVRLARARGFDKLEPLASAGTDCVFVASVGAAICLRQYFW